MSSNDNLLEGDHVKFIHSEEYPSFIQNKINESYYHKYDGVAPEEVLEQLKDFDTWKEWKHNPSILEDMSKNFLKNQ